jgi:multiple sugar transport system permease protein/raffinose/stachyose/melibiose transport system permease protein
MRLWRSLAFIALVLLAVLTFVPFMFLLVNSVKSIPQFYRNFWSPTLPVHFENYREAWAEVRPYIVNSLYVTTLTFIGVISLSSITAFTIARYRFPGRDAIFTFIIAILMVPGILTLVPSFMLFKDLGLLNTYWVMIIAYVSGGQAFAIFVLRTAFAAIPSDLFDSAQIDGAADWQRFWYIGIPLAQPVIGAVAIVNVLGTWNSFIWPLVTVSDDRKSVITKGLFTFASQYGQRYGAMFAGYIIASLPLLICFLLATRLFIRGMTSGAIKL